MGCDGNNVDGEELAGKGEGLALEELEDLLHVELKHTVAISWAHGAQAHRPRS